MIPLQVSHVIQAGQEAAWRRPCYRGRRRPGRGGRATPTPAHTSHTLPLVWTRPTPWECHSGLRTSATLAGPLFVPGREGDGGTSRQTHEAQPGGLEAIDIELDFAAVDAGVCQSTVRVQGSHFLQLDDNGAVGFCAAAVVGVSGGRGGVGWVLGVLRAGLNAACPCAKLTAARCVGAWNTH